VTAATFRAWRMPGWTPEPFHQMWTVTSVDSHFLKGCTQLESLEISNAGNDLFLTSGLSPQDCTQLQTLTLNFSPVNDLSHLCCCWRSSIFLPFTEVLPETEDSRARPRQPKEEGSSCCLARSCGEAELTSKPDAKRPKKGGGGGGSSSQAIELTDSQG